jgi:hypothetical protein
MKRWAVLFLVLILAGCQGMTASTLYGGGSSGGSGGSTNNNAGPPWHVTYRNTTANTSGPVPTDNTSYNTNDTVHVMGNTGPLVWPGFTFLGWNTQDNGGGDGGGGGTFYSASGTFQITSNVTLYGQWQGN